MSTSRGKRHVRCNRTPASEGNQLKPWEAPKKEGRTQRRNHHEDANHERRNRTALNNVAGSTQADKTTYSIAANDVEIRTKAGYWLEGARSRCQQMKHRRTKTRLGAKDGSGSPTWKNNGISTACPNEQGIAVDKRLEGATRSDVVVSKYSVHPDRRPKDPTLS
ncbi:hypothetical protein R1flu_000707 [Riccia fluitans]|uniref:Uncharacterized protein n=1 Tax=Riccia fluitans TaxID=41844 RepID=A0ABD1Y185_9MARC